MIVVFKGKTLPSDYASIIQGAGGTVELAIPDIGALAARPTTSTEDFTSRVTQNAKVQGVAPNMQMELIMPEVIPADSVDSYYDGTDPETHAPHPFPFPPLPPDFFYTTPQQWSVHRVHATPGEAWSITTGSPSVVVAILDTGVSSVHPDTGPKLVGAVSFTGPTPCDDGSPEDQFGHGTWTASLAAGAMGNAGLVIGVAPSVSLLNVKVLARVPDPTVAPPLFNQCRLGGGSGSFAGVLAGIVYAANAGADVISMSLGGFVDKSSAGGGLLHAIMTRATDHAVAAGSVIVASSGNSALDLNRIGPFVHLPSDLANVISVSATTNPALFPPTPPPRQPCSAGTDCLAFYSNFGTSLHGLAAPGGDFPAGGSPGPTGFVRGACSPGVPGTVPGLPGPGTSFGCFSFAGAAQHAWYVQAIGTSASAPHVAGVAALVRSVNPSLTSTQVRAVLYMTAEDIGKVGYDEFFGFGLVNAYAAVQKAQTFASASSTAASNPR